MQVACPSCGTVYNLKPKQIGPAGRTLQCAKCQHKWFVAPPAPEGQLPPPEDLPPLPPSALPGLDEIASLSRRPRWWRVLQLGWGPELSLTLTGLVVGAIALWGINWLLRYAPADDIPSPPPATAAQAAAPHQPGPQPQGLPLSNVTRQLVQRGHDTLLVIRGDVANATDVTTTLPDLRVQLLDKNNLELDYWPASYGTNDLGPGKTTTWQVTFINPALSRVANYRAFFTVPSLSLQSPTTP